MLAATVIAFNRHRTMTRHTVYPKKYAHGFCFAVLCCGYTLTDCPISIRLTSLALWQSNDCPSASKATLMNMDEYFMWIHYERLHNHNKAKHNKTVCIFLGIYCRCTKNHVKYCIWRVTAKKQNEKYVQFRDMRLIGALVLEPLKTCHGVLEQDQRFRCHWYRTDSGPVLAYYVTRAAL